MKIRTAALTLALTAPINSVYAAETCTVASQIHEAIAAAQEASVAISDGDTFGIMRFSMAAAFDAKKAWGAAQMSGWPDETVVLLEEIRALMRVIAAGDELRNEDGRAQIEALVAQVVAEVNATCPEN